MYFVRKGVCTEYVTYLSQFAEGKVNSEIAKNVISVICKSDGMFEYLRLKDHVTTQSVYVFMKSGSKSV